MATAWSSTDLQGHVIHHASCLTRYRHPVLPIVVSFGYDYNRGFPGYIPTPTQLPGILILTHLLPLAPVASNPPRERTPPRRNRSPDTRARMFSPPPPRTFQTFSSFSNDTPHFCTSAPHKRQPPPPGSSTASTLRITLSCLLGWIPRCGLK